MTTPKAIVYVVRTGVVITHDDDHRITELTVEQLLDHLGATPTPN